MLPDLDRRATLLDHLADHMLANGLAGSSLRPMAKAAGTSDRMLLYYFPTKDALIAATLQHVAQRMAVQLTADASLDRLPTAALLERLAAQTLAPRFRPYLGLFLEVASRATRGDALCRTVGLAVAERFLDAIAAQLDAPPEARRDAALRILTAIEGMVVLQAYGIEGRV